MKKRACNYLKGSAVLAGMALGISLIAADPNDGVFENVAGGTSKSENVRSGINDLSGSAAANWSFASANVTAGKPEKTVSMSSSSINTSTAAGHTFSFATFTVAVAGEMTPTGTGGKSGGTAGSNKYDLTIKGTGAFAITSAEAVIAVGGSKAFNTTNSVNATWEVVNSSATETSLNGGNAANSVTVGTPLTNTAGSYTVKATANGESAKATLSIVGLEELQVKINGSFVNFTKTVKILLGKTLEFKAIRTPENAQSWPIDKPAWGGTFGITGSGESKSGSCATASTSDTDYKTIIPECGNNKTGNLLVCDTVLGAHSNVGAGASVTDGHAWITVRVFSATGVTAQSYGLWPDSHPNVVNNGPGWDIRTGKEQTTAAHSRYYLLTPSQKITLNGKLAANVTWYYTHNCSSWASDTICSVTGEDVDADDEWILGVETPREFGVSIDALEANAPTTSGDPSGNGEMVEDNSSSL